MSCASGGIHLEDGPLYQYDTGRRVEADDYEPGDLMDFAREGSCRAISVAADGEGYFPVPNKLLKCGEAVLCWLRRGGETVSTARLEVIARAKPDDYQYIETPVAGYRELAQRVEALEKRIDEGGGTGGGKVQDVEPPLVLDGSTLRVDLSGVRGTQVTSGDDVPSAAANIGDTYIRSNGELYQYVRE